MKKGILYFGIITMVVIGCVNQKTNTEKKIEWYKSEVFQLLHQENTSAFELFEAANTLELAYKKELQLDEDLTKEQLDVIIKTRKDLNRKKLSWVSLGANELLEKEFENYERYKELVDELEQQIKSLSLDRSISQQDLKVAREQVSRIFDIIQEEEGRYNDFVFRLEKDKLSAKERIDRITLFLQENPRSIKKGSLSKLRGSHVLDICSQKQLELPAQLNSFPEWLEKCKSLGTLITDSLQQVQLDDQVEQGKTYQGDRMISICKEYTPKGNEFIGTIEKLSFCDSIRNKIYVPSKRESLLPVMDELYASAKTGIADAGKAATSARYNNLADYDNQIKTFDQVGELLDDVDTKSAIAEIIAGIHKNREAKIIQYLEEEINFSKGSSLDQLYALLSESKELEKQYISSTESAVQYDKLQTRLLSMITNELQGEKDKEVKAIVASFKSEIRQKLKQKHQGCIATGGFITYTGDDLRSMNTSEENDVLTETLLQEFITDVLSGSDCSAKTKYKNTLEIVVNLDPINGVSVKKGAKKIGVKQ